MAGKKREGPERLVEPVSLLGLSLGVVLLGLMETGEGQPEPAPTGPATAEEGPVLRLQMPDGQVEPERCSAASGVGIRRAGSRPLAS